MSLRKKIRLLSILIISVASMPTYATFKLENSGVTINPRGRLLTDVAWYSHDDAVFIGDGTHVRSFRLGAQGRICPSCKYKVAVDFGRSNTALKDVVLSFEPNENLKLNIGQFKPPISLEFIDSSLSITFLERALPNVFVTSRRVGVGFDSQYQINGRTSITYSAGLFTESADNSASPPKNQAYNFSNRFNVNQLIRDNIYWLSGAGFSYTRTDTASVVRYAPRPESTVTDVRFVDTGSIGSAKSASLLNFEFNMQYRRASLQGEYFYNNLDRYGLDALKFDGYYAFASFFFTDDFRPLNTKDARHGRVAPKCKWGALEGSLRYSHVNLNHRDILGGKEGNLTLGMNWYLNPYIRFMANYIHASASLTNQTVKTDIYTLRAQFDFK